MTGTPTAAPPYARSVRAIAEATGISEVEIEEVLSLLVRLPELQERGRCTIGSYDGLFWLIVDNGFSVEEGSIVHFLRLSRSGSK